MIIGFIAFDTMTIARFWFSTVACQRTDGRPNSVFNQWVTKEIIMVIVLVFAVRIMWRALLITMAIVVMLVLAIRIMWRALLILVTIAIVMTFLLY